MLGAIFAYLSRPSLDFALTKLTPDSFTDPVQGNLFRMAETHLDRNHVVLTRQALEDGLRDQAPGTALMYGEYYDSVVAAAPAFNPDGLGAFRHSVDMLRELSADRSTGEVFARGMQILRQGWKDGNTDYKGHQDARTWVSQQFSVIERNLRQEESPEGDMRREASEVMAAYAQRKQALVSGHTNSIATGLPALDKLLGTGLERGELDLIAGYTSSGKTSLVVHFAWHSAVLQGKYVVFFTSETLRPQVRIKILARHSRLERFGLPKGLNSADIKAGRLTPQGEQMLGWVAQDFGQCSGGIYLAQVPKGATLDVVSSRLERITRERPADLVIIDYLQTLRSAVGRRAQWEESSLMVKEAKEMAVTYRRGLGVPVLSPWQISKFGHEESRKRGFMLLSDLAETQEAANSADVLLGLMAPGEYSGGRDTILQASLLKNRDGEARWGKERGIMLAADYATSYFETRSDAPSQGIMDMPLVSEPFGSDDFG